MRCKKHPRYAAKRKPTGNCQSCWWVWFHSGNFAINLIREMLDV